MPGSPKWSHYDGFLFVMCLYEAMWSEDTSGLSTVVSLLCHC
jgi:hypothetical protein